MKAPAPVIDFYDHDGDTYVIAVVCCFICEGIFACNPHKVPSFRDKADIKQPICENCMEKINKQRGDSHLAPFSVDPDAYKAIPEGEL